MNRIIALMSLLLLLSSCTRYDLDISEYFAFGDAYGFCQGDCANFFLIKDNNLYPDDLDNYYRSSLKFRADALPADKYTLAKKLIDNFPAYLTHNPDKTFGCPDCADQGGIHIEILENEDTLRWHFDTNIATLPVEIRSYVKHVKEILELLK